MSNIYNRDWYKKLKRSTLSPPSWVFGVVWPILYVLMGYSAFLIWKDKNCNPLCLGLIYFLIQLIFNLNWTRVFFKERNVNKAFNYLIIIILYTCLTFIEFYKINKKTSYLLIPYILWLFFALYLIQLLSLFV